jgi:sulfur carrier protein ThiS adenylyltransferase
MIKDRDIRQREIVPAEKIAKLNVTVVGVGAIGRQVALQLAAMGIKNLKFIDPDTVAPENLAAQGFLERDLEKNKVDAVKESCQAINSEISITTKCDLFHDTDKVGEVIFCCVDSMLARKFIFNSVVDSIGLFLDTRMSAESMRILAVDRSKGESSIWYDETLFGDAEAYGARCTAKSTIYCASIAAGLAISEFTKWLREMPVSKDKMFNLLSGEMIDMAKTGKDGWSADVEDKPKVETRNKSKNNKSKNKV